MIEIEGLSFARGARRVLAGVSLRLGAGVCALVGPSGAGKTTLLRLVLGLERPSSGTVRIDGVLASEGSRLALPPEERALGMVFQDLALFPHLTVHANLSFGLRSRELTREERERRVATALGWVGLEAHAQRLPHQLSAGERQRVAIARALVPEPRALFLDEPLANLDVLLADDLLELFRTLFAARPLPVLYVTHDPREAARLAAHVVVLEEGRIVQQGSLSELRASPATDFVRAFAGA